MKLSDYLLKAKLIRCVGKTYTPIYIWALIFPHLPLLFPHYLENCVVKKTKYSFLSTLQRLSFLCNQCSFPSFSGGKLLIQIDIDMASASRKHAGEVRSARDSHTGKHAGEVRSARDPHTGNTLVRWDRWGACACCCLWGLEGGIRLEFRGFEGLKGFWWNLGKLLWSSVVDWLGFRIQH